MAFNAKNIVNILMKHYENVPGTNEPLAGDEEMSRKIIEMLTAAAEGAFEEEYGLKMLEGN